MPVPRSVGAIELSSVGIGYQVEDEMLKAASVELLIARTICSGKYLIVIGGSVSDVQAAIQAGLDFHRELALGSENARLISYVENILKATFIYLVLLEPKNNSPSAVHPDEHAHLLDLILQKKKTEAILFLKEHIEESRAINIPFLEERGSEKNPHSRNARIKSYLSS